MKTKTKYIIGASSLLVLSLGSYLFLNNNKDFFTDLFKKWQPTDQGLGLNESNEGGIEQEIQNTTVDPIVIGQVLVPSGDSANVRESSYIDNDTGYTDFTDNLITTIISPNKIGVVKEVISPADNTYNEDASHTWYKVELEESEEYMIALFTYSRVGYVRADVVKKF